MQQAAAENAATNSNPVRKFSFLIYSDEAEVSASHQSTLLEKFVNSALVFAKQESELLQKMTNQRFDLVIFDLRKAACEPVLHLKIIDQLPAEARPAHVFCISDKHLPELCGKTVGTVTYLAPTLSKTEFLDYANKTVNGILKNKVAVGNKVDVHFINPFIQGSTEVLEKLCGIKATREKVFVRADDQISGDVSALVAMNSDDLSGSMAIAFEESTFLGCVSGMLGETFTEVNQEIADAAGEICNQIFGIAKRQLNEKGHSIKPAIPTVVLGKKHSIKHMIPGVCLAVRFSTPAGNFTIEAVVSSNK